MSGRVYGIVLVLAVAILGWCHPVLGQLRSAATTAGDTLEAVTLRMPDTTLVAAYADNPDYTYRGEVAEEESLLSKAWAWFLRTVIAPLLTNSQGNLRWPIYALMALGVGYAVLKLLRLEGKSAMLGRGVRAPKSIAGLEELHTVDLEALLQAALGKHAYREALRLYYLRLLQRMSEERLIAWHPEKTNAEYAQEVRGWEHHTAFRDLTRLYDYVWYGDFPVEVERFETLRTAFDQFMQHLEPKAV